MRIQRLQQRLCDFGEFVVQLVVNAPGQQRERLDHAFDVRVGAAVGLQQQPPGRRRVVAGELLRQLPDEQQLALVVGEKGFGH